MKYREVIKLLVPPIFIRGYHALRKKGRENNLSVPLGIYLDGDYPSWGEALAHSTGYDSELILEKTRDALLQVKEGKAIYERDSVLFDEIQYAWPLLAGLMWVAAQSGGTLNVLDFGGSLGSTYFQNRRFLERLPAVRWNIVEQPRQVEIGKADFEDEHLRFYNDIETCLAATQPNVLILGSVLQYVEHPFDALRTLLAPSCRHLIIDRTPFWDGPTDKLCVQHVPAEIYAASYPSWIFSSSKFTEQLNRNWRIMARFTDPDMIPGPINFTYQGMILARNS